jgi:hypothetical protein
MAWKATLEVMREHECCCLPLVTGQLRQLAAAQLRADVLLQARRCSCAVAVCQHPAGLLVEDSQLHRPVCLCAFVQHMIHEVGLGGHACTNNFTAGIALLCPALGTCRPASRHLREVLLDLSFFAAALCA